MGEEGGTEGGSVSGKEGGWEEEGGSVALLLLHAATLTGTCRAPVHIRPSHCSLQGGLQARV